MEAAEVVALKALLIDHPIAALATLHNGDPAVSMVPFAMLSSGAGFVIHVSQLATHTQDMLDHPAVALLVTASLAETGSALSLHPEKTRLIEFGRHAAESRKRRRLGKPETFDFLGFTFICGKSRWGKFLIKRKSRRDRRRAKLREIKTGLHRRRHQPIPEQGCWLRRVVTGFYAYHAVPTNGRAIEAFRYHVTNLWRRSLRRRSQKNRLTWERITRLANAWLPLPRILHPWPNRRFAVKHPRQEPYAGMLHVRICAGGAQ